MTKAPPKYKLLLDENMPARQNYTRLNSRHNVRHLKEDFKRSGIPDTQVYDFACKERRLIITLNRKDFEPMAQKSKLSGIISVSATMSDEQIDKKVTALLSRTKRGNLFGHLHHLTQEVQSL